MALPRDLTDPATWTLLPGFSSFAKAASGGGDDDEFDIGDDDEDEPEDEDDEDDDEKGAEKDDDADEEKLPDSVKAILRKNRAGLRLAEKRARTAEAKLRDQGKGKKTKDEDSDDDETKLAEAESRGAEKATKIAKVATAKAALQAAGLVVGDDPAASYKKALRVIDLDSLDIDEDGDIEGIEDAITELREDFPMMFSRKRARRGVNGADDKGGSAPKKALSASERQARALTGGKK